MQARKARQQALSARAALTSQEETLKVTLQTINDAISAQKSQGAVVADAALEKLLRQHRELSQHLTGISRQIREHTRRVLLATQGLVDAIDGQIQRLRSSKSAQARVRMRQLLAERGKLAIGPVGGGCAVPDVRITEADGPREAKAKADLIRDAESRCLRRIQRVEKRLAQLQDERKLLQEARDFGEEGSLFDEQSRRRVQTRTQTTVVAGAGGAGGVENRGVDTPAGAPSPAAGGFGEANDAAQGAQPPPSYDADGTKTVTTLQVRQVDSTLGGGTGRPGSLGDEIASLSRRRTRLKGAAKRIREAYQALQKRMRSFSKKK